MFGRLGAVLAAGSALLLGAACSSGGRPYTGSPTFPGLSSIGPSLGVSAPTGIAGVTGATSGKATPSKGSSSTAGRSTSSGVASHGAHDVPPPGHPTTGGGNPRTSTAHTPPPSGPQVSVSPATGLQGGQRVLVVATALPADTSVKIFECRVGVTCTRLARFDVISTDASGRVSKLVTVTSHVGIYACASGCAISVRPASGSSASAPISFA